MGKRTFNELSVVTTGVQSFTDRYGKRRRHEDDGVPTTCRWRCNLTGLSQIHNLYFVAYGRDIYVYVPQFPTQRIPQHPVLIVPSRPFIPDRPGYLDPLEPHSINHLLVHLLGNEEVVATVRDNGDVDAVLVRHVVRAIERRAEPGSSFTVVADELKPIFQANVGSSAWGLAIHSRARILATSSNNHEVRIFKFGLLDTEGESSDADPDEALAGHAEGVCSADRERDVTQRVINGNANIPNIAFCNTGDDPGGRWLLTTDISGVCCVIDLRDPAHASRPVQQFRFGRSMSETAAGGMFDRLNAGWAIMFLDTRSFCPEPSWHAAIGVPADEPIPMWSNVARVWDLTTSVEHVPNNSRAFADPTRKTVASSRASAARIGRSSLGRTQEAVPRRDQDLQMGDSSEDPSEHAEIAIEHIGEHADADMSTRSSTEADESSNETDEIDFLDSDDDPNDEGTEDSISFSALYGGKRIFGNQVYFHQDTNLCEDLPCPIMHASMKNLYLLQPSNQRCTRGPFSPPVVGFAHPLRQAVQAQYGYLNLFDRVNMHAYIPRLGVVVLASQKGRAMVLSLTKLAADVPYPKGVHDLGPKTTYAMRLECILPFADQEAQSQRPFQPLHGLAVGPVQGTETARDDRKRWRLMMMYNDHSILSYEIRRRRTRDSGVDVASLVV